MEEIKELGYPGGYSMVRTYLYPKRIQARPAGPRPPRVRKVVGWIMTPPDALSEEDRLHLKELAESCPDLGTLAVLVRSFGQMLTRREGHRLEGWLDEVRGPGLRALRVFAERLIRDQDAVRAGLSLPWSSGPVEGNVNRIKMLKRQMYGRAGFALLRKRVLLA